MNQITVEKNASGYVIAFKKSRLSLLKAFFTGRITVKMDKETAASLSNSLYSPKKSAGGGIKTAKPKKPAKPELKEEQAVPEKTKKTTRKKTAASASGDK